VIARCADAVKHAANANVMSVERCFMVIHTAGTVMTDATEESKERNSSARQQGPA